MNTMSGLLIVFDQSRSMSWAIDGNDCCSYGQRRLDVAKKAVINAVMELPNAAPVGLILLPYFDPWTPSLVLPICNGNKQKAITQIQKTDLEWCPNISSVYSIGGTPLASALRLAGQVVMQFGSSRVVVLTDGGENCGGNPLAEAAHIRNQGIDLDLHIIGFSVDQFVRQQLIKTAYAGSGRYYDAPNGGLLKAAVDTAVRLLPASCG